VRGPSYVTSMSEPGYFVPMPLELLGDIVASPVERQGTAAPVTRDDDEKSAVFLKYFYRFFEPVMNIRHGFSVDNRVLR